MRSGISPKPQAACCWRCSSCCPASGNSARTKLPSPTWLPTGVPGALLPAVIATELLGSLAIILGWKARVAAFLLAGFSVLTALIFRNNLADQTQMIMFFKNLSIAGGFLLLVVNGAGPLSLDRRFAR